MYSTIPQFKIGDCSIEGCGLTETEGRKVGKNFICTFHYHDSKQKERASKVYAKQRVKGLIKYERAEGILDSVQELILDLDRVVSRYLRLREMDKERKCKCYTCIRRLYWNKCHAGHFINRTHLQLRWDLTYNNHVQCPHCNINLRGNLKVYADNLEREHKGIVQWLQDTAREVYSPTRAELKQLLFDYQQKLHIVEKKLC